MHLRFQATVRTANPQVGSVIMKFGGRYWDRTSDLFGVNQDAAPALTCANALTLRNRGSSTMQPDAFRCSSHRSTTRRRAPHLLPV